MTITLTREEAQSLLAALEELNRLSIGKDAISLPAEIDNAMEILEARLSAPEPEPVAWMNEGDIGKTDWKVWAHGKPTATMPLYAAPPKRGWQGLTDGEVEQITDAHWNDPAMFIEAIEAKLKEKNT